MRRKILFITLGLIIAIIVHNYIEDRRTELIEQSEVLKNRIEKLKKRSLIEESVAIRDRKIKLLDSPSTTGALSKLQSFVIETAKSSGIEILSVRPAPVIKYTYHEGVVLYIEAKGEAGDMAEFLRRLYASERAIFMPKIVLTQSSGQESEELRLIMEIAGLRSL